MRKKHNALTNALKYLLLLVGGAVSVLPMIYMLSTSLRPNGALYEFPRIFSPRSVKLPLKTTGTFLRRKSSI